MHPLEYIREPNGVVGSDENESIALQWKMARMRWNHAHTHTHLHIHAEPRTQLQQAGKLETASAFTTQYGHQCIGAPPVCMCIECAI